MGSMLRSDTFPEAKRNAFLKAFPKLPRVLWKWDQDIIPNKTETITTSKWMPQRDIFVYPNKVKLFITHGGLSSISEAVYEGVPILGIPIWTDHQQTNVNNVKAKGAGDVLNYDTITQESIYKKVSAFLDDPK